MRYDTLRYDTLRYFAIRYDTLLYDTLPYVTIHYDKMRYDALRCVTIRYDTLRLCIQIQVQRSVDNFQTNGNMALKSKQTVTEGCLSDSDDHIPASIELDPSKAVLKRAVLKIPTLQLEIHPPSAKGARYILRTVSLYHAHKQHDKTMLTTSVYSLVIAGSNSKHLFWKRTAYSN